MTEEAKPQEIISITLTAAVDVLAILVDETDDGLVVKDPQMFMLGTNQFIPYAATLRTEDRIVEIPHYAIATYGEAIAFFSEAYRDTFPEHFVLENSALLQEAKSRADIAEVASPVHGDVKSESGIILKS